MAFALSATPGDVRESSPSSPAPTPTIAPTTTGDVPTTTDAAATTEPAAPPEVLFRDDFSDHNRGVFSVELGEPEYRTLSIGFESPDPVPGLRIDVEMSETAATGSHYLGVACVHLDSEFTRRAFAFGIDSSAQSFELLSESGDTGVQLEAVAGLAEIRPLGRTNRVQFECVDVSSTTTRLTLFVNGARLLTRTATSIGGFNQAALVYNAYTGSLRGRFDNLVIRSVGG